MQAQEIKQLLHHRGRHMLEKVLVHVAPPKRLRVPHT